MQEARYDNERTAKTRLPGGPARLRVLFRNRANAFGQPGGDTVLMVSLARELERAGAAVDIDCEGTRSPADYDLVHLFNLCAPGISEPMAREAEGCGRPFVIHACQEDFPRYLSKALSAVEVFGEYVERGQPGGFLESALPSLEHASPVEPITSRFILEKAAAVFACGPTEAAYIRSLRPDARVLVTHYGSAPPGPPDGGRLFAAGFGVEGYVLCVGRLEPRKNQLMLLAALEDSDIPIVFADGGFSYQPEYASLCRRFRRRGRTVFTGRLSGQMLASAYGAAAVHCLPSWYELPGLASIEAAASGCPVAASSWGALPDYLESGCTYFEPDDPAGVREAIRGALSRTGDPRAAAAARRFTWAGAAGQVLATYRTILDDAAVAPAGAAAV